MTMKPLKAVVFGCAGLELTDAEMSLFRQERPVGLILFQRNCNNPKQIKNLIKKFNEQYDDYEPLIMIDQEGGRVQRLKPPHWRQAPPAETFGALANAGGPAARAVWLNARLVAAELDDLGFNVDCAPCLDLRFPDTHAAIGNRAFGADPDLVAELGRAMADGLLAGGILPVIKHIPGHGRTKVDSHHDLPVIEESLEILAISDFRPFQQLADLPLGMTAHLLYLEIDADSPGTQSRKVLHDVIRRKIGFDGLLFSDDLSMNALGGTIAERAAKSLTAGCDIALHCNGDLDEMREVAAAVGSLTEAAVDRLQKACAMRPQPKAANLIELQAELDQILAQYSLNIA
jgi:beta-N-acetylhexosaminidase